VGKKFIKLSGNAENPGLFFEYSFVELNILKWLPKNVNSSIIGAQSEHSKW
jgi:hypothetical protein